MEVRQTSLPDVLELVPTVHGDARGFFHETFRRDQFAGTALADVEFPQENHSRSSRGVLRGMHFQIGAGIGKLVRCARGTIFDVAIDLRRGSPTYGEWAGFELDDRELRQVWIPAGFAHGFYTCSEVADVVYKQTGYYAPELERSVAWDDPDVGVSWPLHGAPLLAARDAAAPRLREIERELPFVYEGRPDPSGLS
ncbi:MAG: dTDP-4-dehydrorhamnose 3,5-epimerase [Solirubrobacteraceae bacterium]|jgi:dTDP-4-dehydrorhamnose 3,5-epimerase